jgi:hypothetical protein
MMLKMQALQKNIDSQQIKLAQENQSTHNFKSTIIKLNETVAKLNDEKKELRNRIYSLYKIYNQQKDALRDANNRLNNDKKNQESALFSNRKSEDKYEARESKIIEDLKKKLIAKDEENAELKAKMKEIALNAESESNRLNKDIERKSKEIQELNNSLEDCEKALKDKRKAYSQIEADLDEKTTKFTIMQKKKEAIEQELNEVINENQKIKANNKKLEEKNNQLSEQLEQEKQVLNDKVRHISELEMTLKKLDQENVSNKDNEYEISSKNEQNKNHETNEQENPDNDNYLTNEEQVVESQPRESDQQSSVMDINDENVPKIVQQLLEKDELKNKSLLQVFKVNPQNKQFTYKDVLKCMAALFFRQKYFGLVKSTLDVWLSAAITQQQNDPNNQTESQKDEKEQSCHSEPFREMIEGDIVELRKPEFIVDKKPTELNIDSDEANGNGYQSNEPPAPKHISADGIQDDAIKIEDAFELNNKDYVKGNPDAPGENYDSFPNEESLHSEENQEADQEADQEEAEDNKKEESNSEDLQQESIPMIGGNAEEAKDTQSEMPNLGNLFITWVMAIFSQCVDKAQSSGA